MIPSRVRLSVAAFRQTRPLAALHHGTRHWPGAADGSADAGMNALQITDPLLIYQSKVARGELEEDQEQIKALVKLRNLTRELQDYTPPVHLLGVLRAAEATARSDQASVREKEQAAANSQTELIRYLSTQQTLADLETPRGLLLTGPPGTGKSMVLDIWFDSLPTQGKFRRHYHHLLLTIYRIIWLEAERRRQAIRGGRGASPEEARLAGGDGGARKTVLPARGTGVLWRRGGEHGVRPDGKGSGWRRVLQGMPFFRPDSLSEDAERELSEDERLAHETTAGLATASNTTLPLHAASQLFLRYGPVMLFDEVQLVDVASAGLLKRTLEAYWLLGGVIVGSSNRLPEDLYNNGVQQQQLVQFFEALRNRCPVHEMQGERDFRRTPGGIDFWQSLGVDGSAQAPSDSPAAVGQTTYLVKGNEAVFESIVSGLVQGRESTPTTLKVYNRPLYIPVSYPPTDSQPGVAAFTFAELCDSPLGPADYLTIVSHFEHLVIRDVPQLTLVNKNQARRWITFIDAAYESGSRLYILAASSPDDLFFPDARHERRGKSAAPRSAIEPDDIVDVSARGARSPFLTPPPGQNYPEEDELERQRAAWREELMSEQLIQSETLSEAQQDVEEGFRPNISSYAELDEGASSRRRTASREEERRADLEAKRRERQRQREREETVVGFPDLAIFSGADERFSYARAVSRLHEISSPIWQARKRWTPLLESELMLWGTGGADADASQGTVTSSTSTTTATTTKVDGSATTRTETTTTTYPSREANPAMALGGDFADEASYERSTFPSRTAFSPDPSPAPAPPSPGRIDTTRSGPVAYNRPSSARKEHLPAAELERGRASASRKEAQHLDGDHYDDDDDAAAAAAAAAAEIVKLEAEAAPPRISPVHVWGQADWGPGAGKWGMGPRGLDREREREQGQSISGEEAEAEAETLRERRARLRRERALAKGSGGSGGEE